MTILQQQILLAKKCSEKDLKTTVIKLQETWDGVHYFKMHFIMFVNMKNMLTD